MPALKGLALTILKYSDTNWKWLETVPLYHFLGNQSVPFESVPIDKPIPWCFWPELENLRWKQKESYNRLFSNTFFFIILHAYIMWCRDVVVFVEDLMELDIVFAQVMLYMCPHDKLSVVLQKVDPILATRFYIWYVDKRGREYITKVKNPEVGV